MVFIHYIHYGEIVVISSAFCKFSVPVDILSVDLSNELFFHEW